MITKSVAYTSCLWDLTLFVLDIRISSWVPFKEGLLEPPRSVLNRQVLVPFSEIVSVPEPSRAWSHCCHASFIPQVCKGDPKCDHFSLLSENVKVKLKEIWVCHYFKKCIRKFCSRRWSWKCSKYLEQKYQ